MTDSANENRTAASDSNWRLKQSEDQVLDGQIIFDLTDNLGSTLASFSMRPETIEALLRPHLSIFADLQLDGTVSLDSEFFALFPTSKTTDIYELVKEGIAPEMLEDEPDVKERLATLRKRLTDALVLVDQTLSNLDKQQP